MKENQIANKTITGLLPAWYIRHEYLLLGLLAAVAFTINLWRGFNENEYITNWVCSMDYNTLLQNRLAAGHFPQWFLWIQFWTNWLGDSEIIYRLPGVIAVLIAVFVFRALAADLLGQDRARLAAILFTLHQLVVWCAQTARPWSGILLFNLLLVWAVVRWLKTRQSGWLVLIAGSTFIGYMHHPNFALGATAMLLPLAYKVYRRQFSALMPIAAILVPMLILSRYTSTMADSQNFFGVQNEFEMKFKQGFNATSRIWFGDWKLWTRGWAKYTCWLLALLTLYGFWKGTRKTSEQITESPANAFQTDTDMVTEVGKTHDGTFDPGFQRLFVLSWIWVPWGILFIISCGFSHHPTFSELRYQLTALGGIVCAIAVALDFWLHSQSPLPVRYRPLAAAVLLGMMLPATLAWWAHPGNGVQKTVPRMEAIYPIERLVGYWQGYNYELRHRVERFQREGRNFNVVDLMYRNRDEALNIMRERIDDHEPFWFVINDNKIRSNKVPLQKVIKNPGPDFEILTYPEGPNRGEQIRLELNEALAVLMRRLPHQKPSNTAQYNSE